MEEHADSAANAAKMTRCDEDKKAERAKLSAVAAAVEVERKQVQDPFCSLTHAPILPHEHSVIQVQNRQASGETRTH